MTLTSDLQAILEEDDEDTIVVYLHRGVTLASSYSPPSDQQPTMMLDVIVESSTSPTDDVEMQHGVTIVNLQEVFNDIKLLLLVYDMRQISGVRLCVFQEVWRFLIVPYTVSWADHKRIEQMCNSMKDMWSMAWRLVETPGDDLDIALASLTSIKVQMEVYRNEILTFSNELKLSEVKKSSLSSLANPMLDSGLLWLRDLVKVYIKYGGRVPCKPKQMILHFKEYIEVMADEDFYTVIHHIESRFGCSTLELIIRNFEHWVDNHHQTFTDALTLVMSSPRTL